MKFRLSDGLNKRFVLLGVMCVSVLSVCFHQVQAQGTRQSADKPKAKQHNRDLPENHANHLKDLQELPGVPKYSGKYFFVEGVEFPSARSGPSFTFKFEAHDKPEVVLDWYKQVFQGGKWDIERAVGDEKKRIGATKDKNICRVLVEQNPDPLYPTRVTLTYRLYQGSK